MSVFLPDQVSTGKVMDLLRASLTLKDASSVRRAINTLAVRNYPEPLMQVLMRQDFISLDDNFASALGRALLGMLTLIPENSKHGFIPSAYIGLQLTRARQDYYNGERSRNFFSVKRDFIQPLTAAAGLLGRIGGQVDTIVDENADLLFDLGLDEDGILAAHRLLCDGAINQVIDAPASGGTPRIGIDAGAFTLMLKKEEIFSA